MSHDTIEHDFDTPDPLQLVVENERGEVRVEATETATTHLSISGPDAEDVLVEHEPGRLRVIGPRQRGGILGHRTGITIALRVPTGTSLAAKLGSADLSTSGRLADVEIRTGSGDLNLDDVDGDLVVQSGSGDLVGAVVGGEVEIKTGSGDVRLASTHGPAALSSGSGDVEVDVTHASFRVKTGSGDLQVGTSHDLVELSSGSGDLIIDRAERGTVSLKTASGDLRVGIPAGVPVWADVTSVSGGVHSSIDPVGEPEPGVDHVEVRARTVSGDVVVRPA